MLSPCRALPRPGINRGAVSDPSWFLCPEVIGQVGFAGDLRSNSSEGERGMAAAGTLSGNAELLQQCGGHFLGRKYVRPLRNQIHLLRQAGTVRSTRIICSLQRRQ